MFNPVGSAYHLLRQVKGKFPKSHELFSDKGKAMMQELAKSNYDTESKRMLTSLHMGYIPGDNEEESNRRAVLAVADAFQLLALWDWLHNMGSEHEEVITYLGSVLAPLVRKMDDQPYHTLGSSRVLSKSLSSSFVANMEACLDYLGGKAYEEAYKLRVNMLCQHYLDLPIIFIEGDTNGISRTN